MNGEWADTMDRFTLFLVMFLAGWNDASQGPLLPSLQSYYDVNYTISKSTISKGFRSEEEC
jgi:fucose permease